MSLQLDHERLAPVLDRLSPYMQRQLALAGEKALGLHADEVALEHFLWTVMLDDDSALFVTVDQAFADTDTVAADLLSLCGGIMVSTRSGALPFSTRGVNAARVARELAREQGLAEVSLDCLAVASAAELEGELAADLRAAGFDEQAVRAGFESGTSELSTAGHLFASFCTGARQALVVAARQSATAAEGSIGPARMLAASLAGDERLAERSGLTARRAKLCIEGRAVDGTPPLARRLAPERELCEFLAGLELGSTSLGLLARVLEAPESELAQVFGRQKITPALLVRAREAYDDPAQ